MATSPLPQLESLVQSLTAHEKRYVRQFITKQTEKDEPVIMQLYNSLLDDKEQKKSTAAPSQQNYLYRVILKALRSYHESKTIDILLRERMINAALLYERRLYAASLKEIDAAQKIAEENERWAALLEMLSLKAEVILEHNSSDITEKLEAVEKEASEILQRFGELTNLKNRQLRIYAFCRINYHHRTEEKIHELKNILPVNDAEALQNDSLLATHYKKMSHAAFHYFTGNFDEALTGYTDLLKIWEKHNNRLEPEMLVYKRFLSNVLSSAHATGNFPLMADVLTRLKSLSVNSIEEEAEKFQNLTYMELLHLMNTDGFDGLDQLVLRIEEGLTRYKTKVNKARELAFCHNISMSYFLLHDWKKSLTWIERIITQEKTEHRQDLQHTARMLRLALWYETGKHDLLEYELVNVERFLRKRKAWFAYESTVVKFFGKLIVTDEVEKKNVIEKFGMRLKEAVDGKTSAALPGSSELSYWARSRVEGKEMTELLRKELNTADAVRSV